MWHLTTLFFARGCELLKFLINSLSICSGKMGLVGFGMVMVAWILLPSFKVIKHLLCISYIPNIFYPPNIYIRVDTDEFRCTSFSTWYVPSGWYCYYGQSQKYPSVFLVNAWRDTSLENHPSHRLLSFRWVCIGLRLNQTQR